MRLYLNLSQNDTTIPINYQQLLTGVIHKWLGKNNKIHGKSGQYSFSWLQNAEINEENTGINLSPNAYFFISSFDESIIKQIIKGVLKDSSMFNGIQVTDIQIKNVPNFSSSERFYTASPILLKWKEEDGKVRHVTVENEDFEEKLNLIFKNQLSRAGIEISGLKIILDQNNSYRKTKLITYNGINNKVSLFSIIIEGSTEQIAYAWCNGLGNSTGIGFGALK